MGQRSELHDLLVDLLGTTNVYFQPPPTIKMAYPCIIYKRDFVQANFADNNPYRRTKRYMVTVVDSDPDSEIPDKVGALPMCTYDRFYTADQLNHDVFKLFF